MKKLAALRNHLENLKWEWHRKHRVKVLNQVPEEVIDILKALIKVGLHIAITGASEKDRVDVIKALVEHTDPCVTWKTTDSELSKYLRYKYPERNLIYVERLTTRYDMEKDGAFVRSEPYTYIVGELDTDAKLIDLMRGAITDYARYTFYSYNEYTTKDLIDSLILKCESETTCPSKRIAEYSVLSMLDLNIHIARNSSGKLVIEHITEVLPAKQGYTLHDLLAYDHATDSYSVVNALSYTRRLVIRQSCGINAEVLAAIDNSLKALYKGEDKEDVFSYKAELEQYTASLKSCIENTFGVEMFGIIRALIQGGASCSITGKSGSGVPIFLRSVVGLIDTKYEVLSSEEMYSDDYFTLNRVYPEKNIRALTDAPIENVENAVLYMGKLELVSRYVQMFDYMENAKLTIFGHYADTVEGLLTSLSDTLAAKGKGTAEEIKGKLIKALNVDIHIKYDTNGERFIDRITEIVPKRKGYEAVDIIRYDAENDRYCKVNAFSSRLKKQMKGANKESYAELESILKGLKE